MTLKTRLADLEKKHGHRGGRCACATGPRGQGWRTVVEGDDWDPRSEPDLEATCRVCGRPRPTLRLEYVDDWRTASGPSTTVTLTESKGA